MRRSEKLNSVPGRAGKRLKGVRRRATPRGGNATPKGEASAEHILDCAIDLLGARGYGGLSISAICARAGVAPTSVYWHFGSKAGLLAAMIERALIRDLDFYRTRVDAQPNLSSQLDSYLSAVAEGIRAGRTSAAVVFAALGEAASQAPEIVPVLAQARRREARLIAEGFARAANIKGGELFARLVSAFVAQASLSFRQTGDEDALHETLHALRQLVMLTAGASNRDIGQSAAFQRELHKFGFDVDLPPLEEGASS
ncbi:MAG: TetR family transcriptional regulator [Alphaproteobacteria bacterium]|nr:TetR family transcriptional regulator [Alphaproteobacteria bacterium]